MDRQCTTATGKRKWPHDTRATARAVAKAASKREGVPVKEYRCASCGKWHVGHAWG